MEDNPGGSSEAVNGGGRASKKKAFNKLIPSSVHKVFSNDDLLIEILLLLPLISLTLFKRVSKRWLSLITSHSFILRRTQISGFVPPSGLFIQRGALYPGYDFLSFDSRKLVKRSSVFTYNSETSNKSFIVQSCNGLLLCNISRDYTKHFVYNPLMSEFKMLPPIHPLDYYTASRFNFFKMAFDPTKSPHYKVLRVGAVHDVADVHGYCFKVQTYCSETGVWTVWDDRFPSRSFFGFGSGVYCNGSIHWFSHGKNPFHFKLEEFADRLVLTKIQSPVTLEGKVHSDRKLFGSYGSLLLLCKDYYRSRKLYIYEMKNGYSEWSIKYLVSLDDMLRRTRELPQGWDFSNIWSIFFGEQEEDSFMVIELFGKVLQYKFGSKTVTTLLDLGEEVGQIDGHDFIASFAQV